MVVVILLLLLVLGEVVVTSATITANESRPTGSFHNVLVPPQPLGWEFAGPTTYVSAFETEEQVDNEYNNEYNNEEEDDDPTTNHLDRDNEEPTTTDSNQRVTNRKSPPKKAAPPLAAAGAVQNLVQQWDGASWFLGSVNGGIWKTDSLQMMEAETTGGGRGRLRPTTTTQTVHWTNVLDGQHDVTCASISALHASPVRADRIYAGCGGSTSSEQGRDWNVVNSGEWGGVMVSNDNGNSWQMLKGFPPNYYVTDILETTMIDDNDDNDNDNDNNDNNNNDARSGGRPILLVSAQSHLFDRDDGGIWRSLDGGKSFAKVHHHPTFQLHQLLEAAETPLGTTILATHARNASHSLSVSTDFGATFSDSVWDPLPWKPGAVPFYTCATVLGNGDLVVAGLSRFAGLPNNTDSQFFVTTNELSSSSSGNNNNHSWIPLQQPMAMDQDGMPKDRMAVLADPLFKDLLYVAGNAGALAWRVNVTTQHWEQLWDDDVVDGSIPHGDCRNFAWDFENDRLLLVTDGGVFARSQPRAPGGRWLSLNGDYASLELLSAHYDPTDGRFVMGAQDNCAIVTKPNAGPSDPGYCFVNGDGAITFVDSAATPSRLFGTTQFLGVGTIERDPTKTRSTNHNNNNDDDDDDDDDEGCGGLCFAQGDNFVEVPVTDYFVEPSTFPFFVHPYTLNIQDPTRLHFWTNGTVDRPSAFYEFHIPYSVRGKDDIPPPTKLLETPKGVYVLEFVSGGYTTTTTTTTPHTAGEPDPDLLVAISNQHLYVRSKADRSPTGGFVARPLPVEFALPIGLEYDRDGQRILGPLTHARTVSMAVSTNDSSVVAITGWQSIRDNHGDESVFVTLDAGKSWRNVTGNLRAASGVSGTLRPGGLCWIDGWDESGDRILLVGTSTGIAATVVKGTDKDDTSNAPEHHQRWMRLGTRDEFPLVLVADIDYEPTSDTLVAATFGRGIYILRNARKLLPDLEICLSMSPKQAFCGECTNAFQEGNRHDWLGWRGECCCVTAEEEPQQRLRATVE